MLFWFNMMRRSTGIRLHKLSIWMPHSAVDWEHWGTSGQIEQHPWLEIYVSTCLAEQWTSLFVFPEITDRDFHTHLLISALWPRQFWLISACLCSPPNYLCSSVCAQESGLVSTAWKVLHLDATPCSKSLLYLDHPLNLRFKASAVPLGILCMSPKWPL